MVLYRSRTLSGRAAVNLRPSSAVNGKDKSDCVMSEAPDSKVGYDTGYGF
jgi:hypothetical protein